MAFINEKCLAFNMAIHSKALKRKDAWLEYAKEIFSHIKDKISLDIINRTHFDKSYGGINNGSN